MRSSRMRERVKEREGRERKRKKAMRTRGVVEESRSKYPVHIWGPKKEDD